MPLTEVLHAVVRDLRLEERRRQGPLATAWDEAVAEVAGTAAVAGLRPVSLRGGTLTVEVEGAALLHRVGGFWAADIARALAARPAGGAVRRIRYVPGGRAAEGSR